MVCDVLSGICQRKARENGGRPQTGSAPAPAAGRGSVRRGSGSLCQVCGQAFHARPLDPQLLVGCALHVRQGPPLVAQLCGNAVPFGVSLATTVQSSRIRGQHIIVRRAFDEMLGSAAVVHLGVHCPGKHAELGQRRRPARAGGLFRRRALNARKRGGSRPSPGPPRRGAAGRRRQAPARPESLPDLLNGDQRIVGDERHPATSRSCSTASIRSRMVISGHDL